MQRRTLLKSLAASGLAGASVGLASARTQPSGELRDVDELYVVRNGEKIETVENPTRDDVLRLQASLSSGEGLLTPDGACAPYCEEDCATVCGKRADCNYSVTCEEDPACCD